MPTRKDLRVIRGGRSGDKTLSVDQHTLIDIAQLLERVGRYRSLFAHSASGETVSLVDDMQDAIDALRRLERSARPEARRRAAEYRRLIAEIDAEIAAALPGSHGG